MLGTAGIAHADNLQADGDAITAGSTVPLGIVCAGEISEAATVNLWVSRNGSYGNPQSFQASRDVVVSVASAAAGLSVNVSDPSITLPDNWATIGNNETEGPATAAVTLNTTSLGDYSGVITFSGSGPHPTAGTTTRNTSITVTATVEDCPAVDLTPPVITKTVSGTMGTNGWYTSNVDVVWIVNDPESDYTIDEGCVDTTIDADTESVTLTCVATSAGGTSTDNVTIKRDATPPEVALVDGPVDGGVYDFGSVPSAPTCSASDALSGLDGDCSVTGYSSAVSTPSHTVTASATDRAGNIGTTSRNYTVLAWTLNGFYRPVDMDGVFNVVKGGSTVPLKFEVYAGATELTSTSAIASFRQTKIACDNSNPTDEIEVTTTGGTSLRYDSTAGQFIQNWKTPTLAGTCYKVTMTTQDGTSLTAFFKLK
ncbi:MAG TPA: PxKF domain-containing protein [Ilumatobacter sp.]|nr:PxKF domain-containing protein [Ilumatobacter sp.]